MDPPSSGSEEMEEFAVSDWDANPNRKRRRMTKEQALYGVFAAEEESDGEGDRRPGGPAGAKRQSMASRPVSFVAGTICWPR